MRKFHLILLTATLACLSLAANAVNFTLNIDDPSRVEVVVNWGSPLENLVAGDNALSADEYQSVQIKAKDGAFITKVIKSMEGADDTEEYVSSMSSCSLYISSSNEGAKWTVTTADANEARDGACRVYVDDPTKVVLQRSGTYTTVNLSEGWNDVKYIKASELPLTISAKNYGDMLYQVKVKGEVVNPEGIAWRIIPEDGDEVEIFANFPAEDVPVKFVYASDEAKGFITGVKVNGEDVTNYNDADFKVRLGSKISISGNTTDYNLVSFKVNENTLSFYGTYDFVVTEETTINIDAHKYGTVKATLTLDNPDNIIVYRGYSYSNDVITGLKPGDNEIELSETNTMIQIKAASGCYITSVTAGDQQISADYDKAYKVTVTEGMKIVVKSGAIERNDKAMVYIDDRSAATTYFNFQRSDRSQIDIASGYNEVNFYEGDNPFGLSWYGASYANVYKNNEAVEPQYPGSTTYELNLVAGDVVKIYLASNPEMLEADITAGANVDASKVAVTMDRINEVTDWAGKHKALPGTEISIKPADAYEICVTVDGENRTADKDGAFNVVVNKNTTIAVTLPSGSGIKGIEAETKADTGVYNLQGMRVADNMKQLPAGIYIINGRKIVKR